MLVILVTLRVPVTNFSLLTERKVPLRGEEVCNVPSHIGGAVEESLASEPEKKGCVCRPGNTSVFAVRAKFR